MLIYEVNLTVEVAIVEAFMGWLKPHIQELLGFEGFLNAMVSMDSESQTSERRTLVVHYYLASEDHYHNYIRDHAPRMRQDGIDRFGSQFTATRRVLTVLNSYSAESD
ncbi:DUF4286 domain-containing protein [Legionella taurinensis]|uniref:DUF4286 domain-containing protein n=1 Tax=Legionella taurinensis TaxID=70611 RepID=A0A3A5L9C6_9GAMM|nr:DUF4286 family protein [Legionella taurinensis]MDX1836976.1 DUF4286 family protein [Legionella taurinensis]PUT41384.1 DUF4286 domain-containing protein [Legionella taurinensis]PUT42623.1 DUF4286 domain-containing protein [Legionella taurinensis]PUT46651.1 DUF4286 domain-containing protein [Legionella taurinensis]PUT47300.1 DUF4286 domain-containing protein [Legionella taurinensis]